MNKLRIRVKATSQFVQPLAHESVSAAGPLQTPIPACTVADTDISIPEYLKRDSNNVPAYARVG